MMVLLSGYRVGHSLPFIIFSLNLYNILLGERRGDVVENKNVISFKKEKEKRNKGEMSKLYIEIPLTLEETLALDEEIKYVLYSMQEDKEKIPEEEFIYDDTIAALSGILEEVVVFPIVQKETDMGILKLHVYQLEYLLFVLEIAKDVVIMEGDSRKFPVVDSLFKQVLLERNKHRIYIGDFMRNNTREERTEILYKI